jgi:hypothetical protein
MFPRALGVVLVVGGVSYLVDVLARLLVPDVREQLHGLMAIPPTIAEVWMVGYLLVRGVKPVALGRSDGARNPEAVPAVPAIVRS